MTGHRAVDLFCGTGGFSRGAHQAGFDVVVAYDNDPNLTYSFKKNFPDTRLLLRDVGKLTGKQVIEDAEGTHDINYGVQPCQGFSLIGKRDRSDPRRSLLKSFFRIVDEARPKTFIMENVEGLIIGSARDELSEALGQLTGYSFTDPTILDASEFGAPTKRRRAFVVGWLQNEPMPFSFDSLDEFRATSTTVDDAIRDLGSPVFLKDEIDGMDHWRIRKNARSSDYARKLHADDSSFTGNKRTSHTDQVTLRFSKFKQGVSDLGGKFPRLSWDGLCPTLRAGTGPDKGSHQAVRPIHPNENRVITVREAARIQGFPDSHEFHPTIWHSFRQIGNSVSPIVAKAVLDAIHNTLKHSMAFAEAAE